MKELESVNGKECDPRIILLVDDDENFLTVLANEIMDYRSNPYVLTAESGEKALKILGTERVDIVVTDLKMPVMNGLVLLSHIKRSYPHIPVIVMSAFCDPEVKIELGAMGVYQCIDKSKLRVLEEMIVGALARRQ